LERTLDDSANRRTLLPEAFLTTDELLRVTQRILAGLRVDETALRRNLDIYGPFAAIERVMMALSKSGADRQAMHERLRQHAMNAWNVVQGGQDNPLVELITQDEDLLHYLSSEELRSRMDATHHLGDAPQRARALAAEIWATLPAPV
jgi:adenylosuccinate lyase